MILNSEQEDSLNRIVQHCEMFEYGMNQTMSIFSLFGVPNPFNPSEIVAVAFNNFALIHLMYTMFLVDKGKSPMGGFICKVLEPLGHASLLEPIQQILGSSLGNVSFGDYTKIQRAKLCTHGDLAYESLDKHQKKEDQEKGAFAKVVPFQDASIEIHHQLMEQLIHEVEILKESVESLMSQEHG